MTTRGRLIFSTVVIAMLLRANVGIPNDNASNDLLIIANTAVPVESITLDEARRYFLMKKNQWPGGIKVLPINAVSGSSLRKAFLSRVLNKSPSEERMYFEDEKLRKGIVPPPEFRNVEKAVFKLKGSIGYTFRSDFTAGVSKVLLVVPAIAP